MPKEIKKKTAPKKEETLAEKIARKTLGEEMTRNQEAFLAAGREAIKRRKASSVSSTILQYFGIVVIGAIIYAICNYSVNLAPLSGPSLLFFSLACAFTWVEVLKWGVTKPFTCIKCMTGWIALLFALVFHVDHWYLYLPAGLFVGALFEAIKMRWL